MSGSADKMFFVVFFVSRVWQCHEKKNLKRLAMARPRARAGGAKTAKAAAASGMAATNQEKGWSKTWVLQAQVIPDKADLKKKVEHLDLHQADLVMGRFEIGRAHV